MNADNVIFCIENYILNYLIFKQVICYNPQMKHQIDPKIDCVFKSILGSEDNQNLLVHFLNAVLACELQQPITSVTILNPYNDKEFLNDKLSIVDVKARDNQNNLYQIEIKLAYYPSLPARII